MKKPVKNPLIAVNRAVYDPAIREVIAKGDFDDMKRLLIEAKAVHHKQGDLKTAILDLEKAILKAGG